VQRASSNDSGDITWVVPTGRLTFPSNVPNLPFHHWCAGAPLATPIAHKGALAGAKALAASALDLFKDPSLVAAVRSAFAQEMKDLTFKSLLPENQKAPQDLNKALMDQWRPLMRPHYVKEKPAFV
jgi:aminobenzoyl-glutamate utilization protein B